VVRGPPGRQPRGRNEGRRRHDQVNPKRREALRGDRTKRSAEPEPWQHEAQVTGPDPSMRTPEMGGKSKVRRVTVEHGRPRWASGPTREENKDTSMGWHTERGAFRRMLRRLIPATCRARRRRIYRKEREDRCTSGMPRCCGQGRHRVR